MPQASRPLMSAYTDCKVFLDDYVGRLHRVIRVDDAIVAQITATREIWLRTCARGGRVVFIGNGGSAGIASHLAIDLSKNASLPAIWMELDVITLSGMSPDNPLRELGDVNYWVDSRSYNIVETAHQFWMMAVIDLIIGRAEYPAS